jgi:2-hydroxycyclohexanecarboxyl-CoA dehydrogenase
VAAIEEAGGVATFRRADLTVEGECAALVDAAGEALGGLTVLVNNAAGGGGDAAVGDLTTARWDVALRLNLTAPMWCTRAAIPHMLTAGHGSIVNISTRQAERASKGFTAYVASKAGLNGLTRAIAVDYAERGIRCNTISPGYVLNERRDADIDDERRSRYESMHLTRLGEAEDVALAAVYLASSESEYLTGVNLQLDGGSSIARGLTLG